MIVLAVAVIVLQWAAIGYLLFDARRERQAHAGVLADFTRDAWQREERLVQRIQAPKAAVEAYDQETRLPATDAPWLGWGSDDMEDRLTKEQLAEAIDGRDA